MKLASLIIGIIVVVGMFIGFIPCLGWFNWFNLPLALVGLVLGILDYNDKSAVPPPPMEYDPMYRPAVKKDFPVGILLCGIALVFGFIRLVVGGGII